MARMASWRVALMAQAYVAIAARYQHSGISSRHVISQHRIAAALCHHRIFGAALARASSSGTLQSVAVAHE